MLAKIIRKQFIFDLIDRTLRHMSNLFETDPDQNGTANMISNDAGFSALATFNSGQLLGFTVELLDFPAKAAHILYDLHVVLRHLVCDDVIRALGRQHNPEKFHLISAREAFDLDDFAMFLFGFRPLKTVHTLVRSCATRIIDLAIILERTVVNLVQPVNCEHHFFRGVPAIHQNCPKRQLFLVDTVEQHVVHMIQLGFAIAVRIINAVINDPELVDLRIDIHTGYDTYTLDNSMGIATVLMPNQFNIFRKILVNHGIIKNNETIGCGHHLTLDVLPHDMWPDFISSQISVRRIMAELLGMVCKVRQRIIDLADKQILAIIQSSNLLFCRFHAGTLPAFLYAVNRFA